MRREGTPRRPAVCHDLLVVRTVLVVLFWLWLAAALGVYLYRLWRRLTQGPKAVREARATDEPAPAPAPPSPPAAPVGTSVPSPADGDGAERSGLFAPNAPTSDRVVPDDTSARPTVAEALQGIAMPCGLAPVVRPGEGLLADFRVAFLTHTSDAATVGAAVGDELERLGYTLSTTSNTEALARRGDIVVRLVIYPQPGDVLRGDDPVFPVAPEGSVGVEFST